MVVQTVIFTFPVAIANTMTKSNLGRKGISLGTDYSTQTLHQSGEPRQDLEGGNWSQKLNQRP